MRAEANAEVVGLARQWVGTPYHHRSVRKGAGCDCLGLLRGLWRDLHGAEPWPVPDYGPGWTELDAQEKLWHGLRQRLTELPRTALLGEGQVLLFRMRERAAARHLGILSCAVVDHLRFIHAYEGHGVIESPLSAPWRRRIVARFLLI